MLIGPARNQGPYQWRFSLIQLLDWLSAFQ
jgi:hypothetical protein